MLNSQLLFHAVYYVEGTCTRGGTEREYNPIAIRPFIRYAIGENKEVTDVIERVEWEDRTMRNGYAYVTKIEYDRNKEIPQTIVITDEQNKAVKLSYLTLALYEKVIAPNFKEEPNFSSTEELQKYYLTTDFYA